MALLALSPSLSLPLHHLAPASITTNTITQPNPTHNQKITQPPSLSPFPFLPFALTTSPSLQVFCKHLNDHWVPREMAALDEERSLLQSKFDLLARGSKSLT